jgi:stage II sporulation protein AA (anti-sigma F factor antagonist)
MNGTTMTVRLCGEMDHHSALCLRSTIDDELFRRRPGILRLDLSGIRFMDSSGLGLIMGRLNLLRELNGELIVCSPSPGVRRILTLSGMDRILRIEDDDSADASRTVGTAQTVATEMED